MKDSFGDRMKVYESRETDRACLPLLPVYARLDGRCFSRFTGTFSRPFDERITSAMIETAGYMVRETRATIGYTQSDEISLVWGVEETQDFLFGGKFQKLTSVLAGMASAFFTQYCLTHKDSHLRYSAAMHIPTFDCRVLQLPSQMEASNMILWREQDATKNAVNSAARSLYSHKQLQGKSQSQMQEMIFQKGVNFNDYPDFFKRGVFLRRERFVKTLSEAEIERIPALHRPPDGIVVRSEVVTVPMPVFSKVTNRVDVVFGGAIPQVASESL